MCEKSIYLKAQGSLLESYFALQTYGCPLCLCVTVHPLEGGGQVAATGGPGGPCHPIQFSS